MLVCFHVGFGTCLLSSSPKRLSSGRPAQLNKGSGTAVQKEEEIVSVCDIVDSFA